MLARALPGVDRARSAPTAICPAGSPSGASAPRSTCSTMGFSISSWRATSICCSSPRRISPDRPLPAGRLREPLGGGRRRRRRARHRRLRHGRRADRPRARGRDRVSRDARDRRAAHDRRHARIGRRAARHRACSWSPASRGPSGSSPTSSSAGWDDRRASIDVPRSSSVHAARRRAHRRRGEGRGGGDRADDREGCRAARRLRPRRPADRRRCRWSSASSRPTAFRDWLLDASALADRQGRSPVRSSATGRRSVHCAAAMRHRLEYLIVRALIALVRVMPDALVRACGTLLGLAFYTVDRAHRRIARAQPRDGVSGALRRRSAARSRGAAFAHFGRLLFELLKFSTLSPEQMLARVEFDGEERARAGLRAGQGRAVRHRPLRLLGAARDGARAADRADRRARRARSTTRSSTTCSSASASAPATPSIYRQGTIRRVMRMLQAGQGVAVLIDQHIMSRDAVYVDFFERPAATTSAVAALALRTGAPVVPVFALPLGARTLSYDLRASGRAAARRHRRTPIREFTQRCTDVLEMYVRRHPELWLWMHRRWRDAAADGAMACPGMFPSAETRRRKRVSAMERLVILAPNWLGDAVMALPAIADVRRAAPGRDDRRRGAGRRLRRCFGSCATSNEVDRASTRLRRPASTPRCCCRTRSDRR